MKITHAILSAVVGVSFLGVTLVNLNHQRTMLLFVHAGPADIYPNSTINPGWPNPAITQGNIAQTICNRVWRTDSIRPPVSYTNRLKTQQIKQYGYYDTKMASYEEDHIISLELGGSPTDPKNLWPEPYSASIPDGGARTKDKVENEIHREVCAGKITLIAAQQIISRDWYAFYKQAKADGRIK